MNCQKEHYTYLSCKAVSDEETVLDFDSSDHVFRQRLVHHLHLLLGILLLLTSILVRARSLFLSLLH